jgi:hypothetical protein
LPLTQSWQLDPICCFGKAIESKNKNILSTRRACKIQRNVCRRTTRTMMMMMACGSWSVNFCNSMTTISAQAYPDTLWVLLWIAFWKESLRAYHRQGVCQTFGCQSITLQ